MSVMSELHDLATTNTPEGAQFYAAECANFHAGWYKYVGSVWYFFKECKVYQHTWRPSVEPNPSRLHKLQSPLMQRWLEQAPKELS